MLDQTDVLFTVTDLKQFSYCQRVFYYHACLPDVRPVTHKMEAGITRHEDEHKRAARRQLQLLGNVDVERRYDVELMSPMLGLSGVVDELMISGRVGVPVDYKFALKGGTHFQLQLAAYALLIEEQLGLSVQRGMLYLTRARRTEEVKVTAQMRLRVRDSLRQMQQVSTGEIMPLPAARQQQCLDCEFRRFCNDV